MAKTDLAEQLLVESERKLRWNDDSVVNGETQQNADETPNFKRILDKGEGGGGRGGEEGRKVDVGGKPVEVGWSQQRNKRV